MRHDPRHSVSRNQGYANCVSETLGRETHEKQPSLTTHPEMGRYPIMSDASDNLDQAQIAQILQLLEQIDAELGLHLTLIMLAVARAPGLSVNELADVVKMPQQTVSRHVAVLQGRYQSPTLSSQSSFVRNPLLAIEVSKNDPRRRAIHLTEDGKRRVFLLVSATSREHEKEFTRVGQS
jgi:DNA-binding MarR family transcriptional regulator